MSYYFASDFHLGLDLKLSSKRRERIIVKWLDSIKSDCDALFLLGDLFDYWFEYKNVVPKGFNRLISKLADFTEEGIPVNIFTGNHDMWMYDYFESEIGAKVFKTPQRITLNDKSLLIGHGDGLGPGDKKYKLLKKFLSNRFNQWLFARFHPNFGISLMKYFSQISRESDKESPKFLGPEKEWLVQYAEQKLKTEKIDYFIFGHRHLPIEYMLSNGKSKYLNAGDWMNHFSYVKLDVHNIHLLKFEDALIN